MVGFSTAARSSSEVSPRTVLRREPNKLVHVFASARRCGDHLLMYLSQGVLRAELQAQGMLGGGGGGSGAGGEADTGGEGGNNNTSPQGEGIFLNMLRRLESVDVIGEDSPRAAAAAAAAAAENGGGDADGEVGDAGAERSGIAGSSSSQGADPQDGTPAGAAAGGVGSSFAGVGAKLRSKFRKPGVGFGLAQGSGGQSGAGGGAADGVGEGGKAFVEGASKALAVNRERVMGWMKDLRPKDWSPKEAGREG